MHDTAGEVPEEVATPATAAAGAVPWSEEASKRQFAVQCAFLERHVPRSYFLEHVDTLSAGQYRDVLTERAIAGLCGFPLCPNSLPAAPARRRPRYRISVREKRVYDVSERINFCSDECLIAAKLEEVHLRDSDEQGTAPPISRSIESITERADVEPPSTFYRDTGEIEGYTPAGLVPRPSHEHSPILSRKIHVSNDAPQAFPDVASHKNMSTESPPAKAKSTGRTPEDWIKQGPAILKSMMDQRRKVQMISLDEAIQLEKELAPAPSRCTRSNGLSDEDESSTSDDEEDTPIKPAISMLPLFAQLWNALSDWPTERSRNLLYGGSEEKMEYIATRTESITEGNKEHGDEDLDDYCALPISDSDQERARWRAIRNMLLRELPTVCAQLKVSVPIYGQLCRLLESFTFPKPLAFKPQQLRLVLMVLLHAYAFPDGVPADRRASSCRSYRLGPTDDTLRAQLEASDAEREAILARHRLTTDEWRLLVEIFVA